MADIVSRRNRRWHCYADLHSHDRSSTRSQSSRSGTKCCHEWQFLLTRVNGGHVFVYVERRSREWWEKSAPGLMMCLSKFTNKAHVFFFFFSSKDNVVLICGLRAWFECLGYPLLLIQRRTHTDTLTRKRYHAIAVHALPEPCIWVLFLPAVSWILTWRGLSPLCSGPGPGAEEVTAGHEWILMSCETVIDWPHRRLADVTHDCHLCLFIIWRGSV